MNTLNVIRNNSPKEIFGFNVPWRDFQQGYYRNGNVRAEVVDLLAPFQGASYRYPGGSPSNTFEWKNSIGIASQRPLMHSDFNRFERPYFGIDEFANFVKQVDGKAIITLNLSGPYGKKQDSEVVARDAVELMNYIRQPRLFGCVGGPTCRISAWELGNEMDWAPFLLTAEEYGRSVNVVSSYIEEAQFDAVLIAGGRTAPWDKRSENYVKFNSELASLVAKKVHGIAIHPYYDGVPIVEIERYIESYSKAWTGFRSDGKIFVTEHARWPPEPSSGKWSSNWHKATGLGGALSTSEFILSLILNKNVTSANWHALSSEGPWQLIRWNRTNDSVYPSPVYWGMRVLRDAYLDHVVNIEIKVANSYGESFTPSNVRVLGMVRSGGYSKDNESVSLLGVNKNDTPIALRIDWLGIAKRSQGLGLLRILSGDSYDDDNTNDLPNKISMQIVSQKMEHSRKSSVWCIPARSVFSIVEP